MGAALATTQKRHYRRVPGMFNLMAVCSLCDRDASQTRLTWLCVDILADAPARCDECRGKN